MKHSLRKQDDAVVVELEGEADLAVVPEFQKLMRAQMETKVQRLVIDFSKVTFVNTPIWAVVVEYYQYALNAKAGFAIAGLQSRVEASFSIVRLGDFIAHHPTVEEALSALKV